MKKAAISSVIAFGVVLTTTLGVMAYQNQTQSSTVETAEAIESATVVSGTAVESDIIISDSIVITEGGEHVLSGTIADGQILVQAGDEDVTLILNGVDVTNSTGAAIYIKEAGDVTIELAEGSTNILTQTGLDSTEEEKAALYSASDLEIIGEDGGTLYVQSTVADGVSTGDDLVITSGNITVASVDDGIRGKDSVTIYGGAITVDAEDDGIKTTNTEELGRGTLTILGGIITVTSGDDAIKAEQEIIISGGTINIPMSAEGVEAPVVTIDGGDITIYATDDGINAAASDIITTDLSVTINGGTVDITMTGRDVDGIDANGSIAINGGAVSISYPEDQGPNLALDYDTTATFTGGTIIINGEQVDEIPVVEMRGPGGGGFGGGVRDGAMPPDFDGTRPEPPSWMQ